MNLQTSYFSSKAPKERKVCIAKWNRFWSGPRAAYFAPSNPKATDWQAAFRADFEARFPTPEVLHANLQHLCKETPDPILCCYEKDPADCHRSILAAFIQEKLGITVGEWAPAPGEQLEEKTPTQTRKKSTAAKRSQLMLL